MAERPPALGWALIAGGVLLCALTTWLAPGGVASLGITSDLALLVALYGAIFVPLALVALLFARLDGFAAARIGDAPGVWSAIALLTGGAGLAAAAGYAALAGSLVPGATVPAAAGGLALGALMLLFQTGSEELFFRGWLQAALTRRLGIVAALAIASLLFMAFHILGGARSPLSLANLLLGGAWFGLLAWRSGGLLAPWLAHFGWNASEELVAGLTPNPGTGSFGALRDWDLLGGPLWGGTHEGLNTSIGMTIVLAALIVPLAWRPADPTAPAAPAPRRPDPAAG